MAPGTERARSQPVVKPMRSLLVLAQVLRLWRRCRTCTRYNTPCTLGQLLIS